MNYGAKYLSALILAGPMLSLLGCSDSTTSPSAQPYLNEGSISLGTGPESIKLVNFGSPRTGVLTASVDWTNSDNDIDIYLFQATCSIAQIVANETGCTEDEALSSDTGGRKPATLPSAVTVGGYTHLILNYNEVTSDTATYRVEIN